MQLSLHPAFNFYRPLFHSTFPHPARRAFDASERPTMDECIVLITTYLEMERMQEATYQRRLKAAALVVQVLVGVFLAARCQQMVVAVVGGCVCPFSHIVAPSPLPWK